MSLTYNTLKEIMAQALSKVQDYEGQLDELLLNKWKEHAYSTTLYLAVPTDVKIPYDCKDLLTERYRLKGFDIGFSNTSGSHISSLTITIRSPAKFMKTLKAEIADGKYKGG